MTADRTSRERAHGPGRGARSRLALGAGLALLAAIAAGAPRAQGQPTVRVRAETRIELRAERSGDLAAIRGILRDDLGVPLPGRRVDLFLEEHTAPREARHAFTREDGGFEATFRVDEDATDPRLRARFGGDPTHEAIQVERPLGRGLHDVRLEVELADAARLDLDLPEHALRVRVETEGPPSPLRLEVMDELDRPLASGVTDATGRASFRIASERLGAPGPGRIKVRSTPDAAHPEAQTEVPIVRVRHTQLTLTADRSSATPGEGVVLRGELSDSRGPLAGRAVGLYRGEDHLASLLTDRDGRFEHILAVEGEPPGTWVLVARFESNSPGRLASASEPLQLAVALRAPPTAAWLLVPVALCALLLGGLARRARAGALLPPAPRAEPRVGIRREASGRGRPAQAWVSGRVVDHRDDAPLPTATVELTSPDGTRLALAPDTGGHFRSPALSAGGYRLRVEATGYEPVEAVLRIPHRGEWSGVAIRLRSLRSRALAAFRRVVLPLLPSEAAWSSSTNREIAENAPPEVQVEIAEIEAKVEVAYYGPIAPSLDEVESIEGEVATTEARWRRSPPAR